MKSSILRTLFMACAITSASALCAQSAPGNSGTTSGSSTTTPYPYPGTAGNVNTGPSGTKAATGNYSTKGPNGVTGADSKQDARKEKRQQIKANSTLNVPSGQEPVSTGSGN